MPYFPAVLLRTFATQLFGKQQYMAVSHQSETGVKLPPSAPWVKVALARENQETTHFTTQFAKSDSSERHYFRKSIVRNQARPANTMMVTGIGIIQANVMMLARMVSPLIHFVIVTQPVHAQR